MISLFHGAQLPYFKFGESKFINLALNRGSIRVGTLDDFRKAEHKCLISDKDEGTKQFHFNEPQIWLASDMASLGLPISGTGKIIFRGNSKIVQHHPNCFIYCLSNELSLATVKAAAKSKYVSCMMIIHLSDFTNELARALIKKYPRYKIEFEVGNCTYDIRNSIITQTDDLKSFNQTKNPVFLKDKKFETQKEVRIVGYVDGSKQNLSPTNLEIKGIKNLIIKVDISKIINLNSSDLDKSRLCVMILLKNDKKSCFSARLQSELFAPVIFFNGFTPMIGFRASSREELHDPIFKSLNEKEVE